MPNMTRWKHEPYILDTTFTGILSVDEIDEIMNDYLGRLNEGASLYLMVNFARAVSIPTTLLQMDSVVEVLNHANLQWLVMVNPVGFDSNTTRLLAQDKVKVFESKEKALGFLRGMVRLDTGIALESD